MRGEFLSPTPSPLPQSLEQDKVLVEEELGRKGGGRGVQMLVFFLMIIICTKTKT